MTKDRFAYEEAEAVLNRYALGQERTTSFRRAYVHFKGTLLMYALIDFSVRYPPGEACDEETDVSMAHAWEEAQVAFRAEGEYCIVGAIFDLWLHTPGDDYTKFKDVIDTAFYRAEAKTPATAVRMYSTAVRNKPLINPITGFRIKTHVPEHSFRQDLPWADSEELFLAFVRRLSTSRQAKNVRSRGGRS
jgi:hypothetical protein